MRTKKRVDVKRLAEALTDYPFAYLITVDDDYRAHTVTVEPRLRDLTKGPDGPGAILDVGVIGGRTRNNLARRRDVTLLWPPTEPGGYSLIVDGSAEVTGPENPADETVRLGVVPTRALLHREADSPGAAKGCLHDCVVFSLPA
ncbi:pyridoxamine 5'-phosphate oxidase family protein [Mycobacterium sp.]|uniref:pyridoxamine 5'-phosphate oxidase family protein n=1 Tax=Mycobacterium sp. TaxID=1785 RepID=UPI002C9CA5B9|nr:pyridoxamine 5'-phosphate oxidase family protein [Mycobacterium sp.]HTY33132.1 pyridoxamine 5'-phosphate oxidase family protein [Mycobacterium sp.]